MKKRRLFLYLSLLLGVSLLLAIGCIALLQTSLAQDYLWQRLSLEAKKQNIVLHVERPELTAPFQWTFAQASARLQSNEIEIKNLTVRINPFSLLKKKLSIQSLKIEEIQIVYDPSFSTQPTKQTKLPLAFQIKKMQWEKVTLTNSHTEQSLFFSISGKGKTNSKLEEWQGEFLVKELTTSNKFFLAFLSSHKRAHKEFSWNLKLKDPNHLNLFLGIENVPSFENRTTLFQDDLSPLFFNTATKIYSFPQKEAYCLTHPLFLEASGSFSDIISCTNCHLQTSGADLTGSFLLSFDGTPLKGDLSFSVQKNSDLFCLLPLSCDLQGKIHLDSDSFSASLLSPSLTIQDKVYGAMDVTISATKKEKIWEGDSLTSLSHLQTPWKNSFHFILAKEQLLLSDLSLSCAEAHLEGKASLFFPDLSYQGSFFIKADELRPFRDFLPDSELDGKLGASLSIQGQKRDLSCKLSCLAYNIRYQNSLMDVAHIEADIDNLLDSPSGTFSFDAKDFYLRDVYLSELSFSSLPESLDKQSFSLEMQGVWKQPLSLKTTGFYSPKNSSWNLDIDTCTGSFLAESFTLKNPFSVIHQNKNFSVTACLWQIGQGTLSFECFLNNEELSVKGEGISLPLNTLGILYPRLAFQGIASFQTSITGKDTETKGHFLLALEQADLSPNKSQNAKAKGSLQVHFSPLGAQIHTHLYGKNDQFLEGSATLPMQYSYNPFYWKIDTEKPVTGDLTMQGAIEDLFDFVNTSSHKASGWITAHLLLAKTLKEPHVLGSLEYQNGSYENYFTGTKLKQIEATITASQDMLQIKTFEASDTKDGHITGTGFITLAPERLFPFDIQADLTQMHSVKTDFIDGSFSGSLQLTGNSQKARASGNVTSDLTTFTLSEDLLNEIPSLPVTFIHKPISLQIQPLQPAEYPLELDIYLKAEKSVFVKGRGLDSIWQGDVHLSGTVNHLVTNGTLILQKGTFVFSGKSFALTQGEISFADPNSYIKIRGELPLSAATIIFQMQGPLTSPALTFQSIPSLPTSSILSLILFDKDISEISALQALSLAQTIVSLSGKGGPGVLESIRKTIGVDRLHIVGKDGSDEISVQIGWYLSHGITLSLSQSATSSDITVEVDLKNGFIFQAETQNQEEGKFSLKWNKNY